MILTNKTKPINTSRDINWPQIDLGMVWGSFYPNLKSSKNSRRLKKHER